VWWDIGANIGWFTLHLSRIVKATGKVVAFEPNPFTAKLLQRALKDSVSTNVLFCELALGDGSASAILHVPLDVEHTDGGYGRPSLIRQSDIADYAEVTVSVSSADEQIQRGTPIPFGIKMDVEGFESAVLAGATHLFKQSPPSVILCEATHRPDVLVQPVELVQSIRNFGYRAYHVENLREYDPTVPLDGSWSKDFVFLHHRVAETLLPRLLGHEAGSKVERPTSNRP
jgi:FkbM family methyltransferase